jgi:hypothetical protein
VTEARIATRYQTPEVRDLGHLTVLTAFEGGGLHFAQASLGSLPGGGGGQAPSGGGQTSPAGQSGVLDTSASGGATTPHATDVPDGSGVKDTTASGGSGPGSSGTAGSELGSNGTGSAGDSLPFTGLAVGPVAAAGAGLAAAGATLRRWAGRA